MSGGNIANKFHEYFTSFWPHLYESLHATNEISLNSYQTTLISWVSLQIFHPVISIIKTKNSVCIKKIISSKLPIQIGGGGTWARFLSLARSRLRLCSASHRACDWLSIVWAYSKRYTENGSRCDGIVRSTTAQRMHMYEHSCNVTIPEFRHTSRTQIREIVPVCYSSVRSTTSYPPTAKDFMARRLPTSKKWSSH